MAIVIREDKIEELRERLGVDDEVAVESEVDLGEVEKAMSYSLADAIREGSSVTGQQVGDWSSDTGEDVCALSAGLIAVRARRMI